MEENRSYSGIFHERDLHYSTLLGKGSWNSADSMGVLKSITQPILYFRQSAVHSSLVKSLSFPLRRYNPCGTTPPSKGIPPRSRRLRLSRFIVLEILYNTVSSLIWRQKYEKTMYFCQITIEDVLFGRIINEK